MVTEGSEGRQAPRAGERANVSRRGEAPWTPPPAPASRPARPQPRPQRDGCRVAAGPQPVEAPEAAQPSAGGTSIPPERGPLATPTAAQEPGLHAGLSPHPPLTGQTWDREVPPPTATPVGLGGRVLDKRESERLGRRGRAPLVEVPRPL